VLGVRAGLREKRAFKNHPSKKKRTGQYKKDPDWEEMKLIDPETVGLQCFRTFRRGGHTRKLKKRRIPLNKKEATQQLFLVVRRGKRS